MPKKTGWILGGVIVAVIAAYAIVFMGRSRDAESAGENLFAKRQGTVLDTHSEALAPRTSFAKQSHPLESGYRWDPNNPGIAESQQDAAWLEAHGYPGPDVEAHLMSLSLDALKDLADGGNKPAQAFYALRLAQSGSAQSETQEILLKSAASGSVFALKMAGDIYYTVDAYRDPVMASVFYGLQARQGDHAGITQNYLVDSTLKPDQRLRAQALRELTWLNMRNIPIQGNRRIEFSPRPGHVEFLEQALLPKDKG